MNRFLVSIASFVLGASVTAAGSFLLWLQISPSTSEVWTTATELKLGGGIVIPRDVELIQERWMPEGFVTLKLYVNVEGDALDKFSKRTEAHRNLVTPYWVEQ